MEKINELLLQVKYHQRGRMNWQDIAGEIGVSIETLRKLRFEGFYDGLRWEQIQRLAGLLGMQTWELVKVVEESVEPEPETVPPVEDEATKAERIRAQNEYLRQLLQTAPEDDKGPEWWAEFEQELRQNRLTFPERELE
jgi:hypothetical protein